MLPILLLNICYAQVYVSTGGADSPGRGDAANPYRTIVYAVQQALAGSIIYIASGTYNESTGVDINKPLTLVKNGTLPVIIDATNRTTPVANKYMLAIINTSNVIINGLTFQNFTDSSGKAIWILGNSSNDTIRNCILTNIGWISNNLTQKPPNGSVATNAIRVEGSTATAMFSVAVLNNVVTNCATGWGEAITITGNVDGFLIESNSVHEIANIGIVAAGNYSYITAPSAVNYARNGIIRNNEVYNCMSAIATSAGIYLDGSANCIVERNKVYQNGAGISIGGEQPTGIGASPSSGHRLYNNLVYNNAITGIFIGTGTSNSSNPVQNTTIYNNTFYKNRTGANINGVTTIDNTSVSALANNFGGDVLLQNINGVTMQNNIIYPLNSKRAMVALGGYIISNFASDYNNYYREDNTPLIDVTAISFNGSTLTGSYSTLSSFTSATGLEANSFFGNPSFTNATSFDFSLTGQSVGINKGNLVYSATLSGMIDYASFPRVYNNVRIDAGAYEYQLPPLSVLFSEPLQIHKLQNDVILKWATFKESKTKNFEIERKSDNNSFEKIGEVNATGNSANITYYSWTDKYAKEGTNYYRLKIVDFDGKYEYSIVQVIILDHKTDLFTVSPNPTKNSVSIEGVGIIEIKIADNSGKIIYYKQQNSPQGQTFKLNSLAKGVYFIQCIVKSGALEVKKLVVE